MKTRNYWLFFSIFLGSMTIQCPLIGQNNYTKNHFKNSLPSVPPPEVASFVKYEEVPVSHHTGIPQIRVPIYTIEAGDFLLPVDLTYHAGGIRIEDEETRWGLGWSLTAEGAINQTIKSLNYYTNQSKITQLNQTPNNPPSTDLANYSFLKLMAENKTAIEPDLFSFYAPGINGKFFKEQSGVARFIPKQMLRYSNNVITDENGTQYHFGGAGFEGNTSSTGSALGVVNKAYYLKKILTNEGYEIKYEYQSTSIVRTPAGSETKTLDLSNGAVQTTYEGSTLTINALVLRKITFPSGYLTFIGNEIKLYDNQNQLLNRWILNYGHFVSPGGNTSDYKRLKLLSVEKRGGNGSVEPAYTFEYNTEVLPHRKSKAQDHWGFYNNNIANTLIPRFELQGHIIPGANREADSLKVKACILEKINYPTGGSTRFEYECNTYPDPHYAKQSQNATLNVAYNISSPNATHTLNFNLNHSQYTTISVIASKMNNSIPDPVNGSVQLEMLSSGNWVVISGIGLATSNLTKFLNTGSYRWRITPDINTKINASVNYKKNVGALIHNRLAGGVRVKKITTYDGLDHSRDIIRSFNYDLFDTQGKSSAILANDMTYDYRGGYWAGGLPNNINCLTAVIKELAILHQSSASKGKQSVYYSQVTEYIGEQGSKGKIRYIYNTAPNLGPSTYISPTSYSHRNGKLLKKMIYHANGTLQKEIINTFEYPSQFVHKQPGVKVRYYAEEAECTNTVDGQSSVKLDAKFSRVSYNYVSEWVRLSNTVTKDYLGNPSSPVVQQTNYYYDSPNHYMPTRIVTLNSKGETLTDQFKYPQDYSSGSSHVMGQAIDWLKNTYRIGSPIETVNWINKGAGNLVVNANLVEYSNFNYTEGANTITRYLPSKIYETELTSPQSGFTFSSVSGSNFNKSNLYKEQLLFDKYDKYNNILQIHFKKLKKAALLDDKGLTEIASANNTYQSDIAFASFEPESKGDWWLYNTNSNVLDAYSGKYARKIIAQGGNTVYGPTKDLNLSKQTGKYIVSAWVKTSSTFGNSKGKLIVHTKAFGNNNTPYPTPSASVPSFVSVNINSTQGKWKFVTCTIDLDAIRNGSGIPTSTPLALKVYVSNSDASQSLIVDDITVRPEDAELRTYTYNNRLQTSSFTSPQHKKTTYEYDDMGRMILIRDHNNQIRKKAIYHYHN